MCLGRHGPGGATGQALAVRLRVLQRQVAASIAEVDDRDLRRPGWQAADAGVGPPMSVTAEERRAGMAWLREAVEARADEAERGAAASHIARSWRAWWASTGMARRLAEAQAELRQLQAAQRPALVAKARLARQAKRGR